MNSSSIVTADWLKVHMEDPEIIILDATVPKVTSTSDTLQEVQIIGAQFFDINGAFSDPHSDLPHMMCNSNQFEDGVGKLGISKNSQVIIYDQHGIYSAPRAWWMFKSMGHENVAVLDGGLPHWIEKDYPTEAIKENQVEPSVYKAHQDDTCFVDAYFMLENLKNPDLLVLDARSKGRFDGTAPEPREGLRSGHIPGSLSLPFPEVLNGTFMKSDSALNQLFQPFQLQEKHIVFSCGSGLTACIILLAAHIAGFQNLSVYDGSWSEWGQPSELPVA